MPKDDGVVAGAVPGTRALHEGAGRRRPAGIIAAVLRRPQQAARAPIFTLAAPRSMATCASACSAMTLPVTKSTLDARRMCRRGLVDGLGDLRSVMRERYGEKVKLRVVGRRRGWLDKRLGMRNDWADELIGAVESRALWSRYGL